MSTFNRKMNIIELDHISEDSIEIMRQNIVEFFETYRPSELLEFEEELKSLISALDIKYEIRDDETFLSGYLWAWNDLVESMLNSCKENEKTRILREDKLLLEVVELFRHGGSYSNNTIAKNLSKSKSAISKLMNRPDVKHLDLFICEEIKQKKYYTISPKGISLYLTYHKKSLQEKEFNKLVGSSSDFYSCQNALSPTIEILECCEIREIKSYDDKTMFENKRITIDKDNFDEVLKYKIGL